MIEASENEANTQETQSPLIEETNIKVSVYSAHSESLEETDTAIDLDRDTSEWNAQ